MENILEELYWLCNEENLQKLNDNKHLQRATNIFSECENILTERLKDKDFETFLKFVNVAGEINSHTAFDNFIDGVKVGAKLMIEILAG